MYAVVGIPFTLIFLSALVQRLLAPTFKLLSSFIKMLPNMDTFQVVYSIDKVSNDGISYFIKILKAF